MADADLNKRLGQRLRDARVARGISQQRLAGACDISFQQVQKYERGTNRIPIDRLAEMCAVLGVPLEEMVRGLDDEAGAEEPAHVREGDKSALAVIRHFNRMESQRLREVVQRFIRDLADTQHELAADEDVPAELADNHR